MMTLNFFWRLPVDGDGRSLRADLWSRGDFGRAQTRQHDFVRTGVNSDGFSYFDQLSQIARAAELAGFTGISIPQTAAGEEPLIVAGAAARDVRRLTLLPSLPAYFLSAVYAAKIAVSFQRLTTGRLAWEFVTEAPTVGAWHGHGWSVAEQIARTGEFLDVAKGFWHDAPFTYQGNYYEVENGGFASPLAAQPFPLVYLSGDTAEALALSARHADIHILNLSSPASLRNQIAALDALATGHGRRLRYALRTSVVARHSDDAARDQLHRQSGQIDETTTGLVGGYDSLAGRFAEFHALGIDSFILSSRPHLEEAYRIGEQLIPLIHDRVGALAVKAA